MPQILGNIVITWVLKIQVNWHNIIDGIGQSMNPVASATRIEIQNLKR